MTTITKRGGETIMTAQTQTEERRKSADDIQRIINMVTELAHKFDLFVAMQEACHKEINTDLMDVMESVHGNGKDGLIIRVDRLEVFMADLKKSLSYITIGIIMLLITAVINLILK
jgi:t-SNARE complex subunit (syntaxin)